MLIKHPEKQKTIFISLHLFYFSYHNEHKYDVKHEAIHNKVNIRSLLFLILPKYVFHRHCSAHTLKKNGLYIIIFQEQSYVHMVPL